MNIFDKVFGLKVVNKQVRKETKGTGSIISERQQYAEFVDLNVLENDILTAENVTAPNRRQLHNTMKAVELDPHYQAQWETRKMKTIEREFALFKKGSEDQDDTATEIFQASWFHDLIHLLLDSKKRGHILIEFGPWENGDFQMFRDIRGNLHKGVSFVPFEHINPIRGELLKNDHDIRGRDIFKAPVSNRTLWVGDPKSYGISYKAARYILIKNNAFLNWSEWAEVFGHDVRIGKTDAIDDERTKFLNAMRDLGAGGYGVFNTTDEIEYVGSSRQDAYEVYEKLLEYADKNISKLVFGQDTIMEMTGKVRGDAAENITDMYGENDAKFIAGIVNSEVIPKLQEMGVKGLDGVVFQWDNSESLSLKERAEIDALIAKMGHRIDPVYLAETYNVVITEDNTGTPEEIANRIKKAYGISD